MSDALPATVHTFVSDHVHSVGELELLMLLRGGGDRTWTVEDVCAVLGAPPRWARAQLHAMTHAGLLRAEHAGWRYAPQTAPRRAVDAVAHAYATRRRDLVHLIFSLPAARARASRLADDRRAGG